MSILASTFYLFGLSGFDSILLMLHEFEIFLLLYLVSWTWCCYPVKTFVCIWVAWRKHTLFQEEIPKFWILYILDWLYQANFYLTATSDPLTFMLSCWRENSLSIEWFWSSTVFREFEDNSYAQQLRNL